ncbi:hypothetical protein, partial [Streptomyces sp. NPDC052127]|uniref:hypothetical protein n=1 Tax=Streptomyces sp. NPDC052127 TaxID=3155679 RepID=UPI0034371109
MVERERGITDRHVRVQPVALALEGVGGQIHTLCAAPGEHLLPVHIHTTGVQLPERGEQGP